MAVDIRPTGYQHSILAAEIYMVIAYPLIRFAITTRQPDANTYMFIGRIDNEARIEVAAEDEDGTNWAVFHAMMLTTRTAREAYEHSAGSVDLRDQVPPQRPFIGPQYK